MRIIILYNNIIPPKVCFVIVNSVPDKLFYYLYTNIQYTHWCLVYNKCKSFGRNVI